MENKREQWGSNVGFLLAAIGSAVGLGNIWGFPYKMGTSGGFAFLLIYLIFVVFVGFSVMLGEIALGRKFGKGILGTYQAISKKYTWVGLLGLFSSVIILSFYAVLGGIVVKYMGAFFLEMLKKGGAFNNMSSNEYFGTFIMNANGMLLYFFIFLAVTALVVMGGIKNGIEKFSKIGMPALFVILIIIIVRSVTLPGAQAGLAFMFKPDFAKFQEIGFFNIIKSAAQQMFFSLSLGVGCIMTYGSYLSKKENIEKNALIIPIADTAMALMAGLAVMPAVGAFAGVVEGISFNAGPGLLFITLHTVFLQGMGGFMGAAFGFLFYFLVFIAALSSSVSLFEVPATFVADKMIEKSKKPNRKKITLGVMTLVFVIGSPVALDGLGGGNLIDRNFFFGRWGFLDFYDLLSEGIFMPLGALIMSVLIGWRLKTGYIKNEIEIDGHKMKAYHFWTFCFKFIVPLSMIVVLYAQLRAFGIL